MACMWYQLARKTNHKLPAMREVYGLVHGKLMVCVCIVNKPYTTRKKCMNLQ